MEQRVHTELFLHDDREIARARHVVVRLLGEWGLGAADASVMELLVSELVTNAVVHGAGPIVVRLATDGDQLRLEVTDEDGRMTRPRLVDHREIGGWGLRLVDRLCDRWGADTDRRATRVWTEVRVPTRNIDLG
jgi:anti-sigma regulatory factor (Ser/Thr protein kinase)